MDTKPIELNKGKLLDDGVLEAIGLLCGVYSATVRLPCIMDGPYALHSVLREMVILFEPLHVRVRHDTEFQRIDGASRFKHDLLVFAPAGSPAEVKQIEVPR